jgi:hypothetical protein
MREEYAKRLVAAALEHTVTYDGAYRRIPTPAATCQHRSASAPTS